MLPAPHSTSATHPAPPGEFELLVALACRVAGAGSGALLLPATSAAAPHVVTTHGTLLALPAPGRARGAEGLSRTGSRASVPVPLADGRAGVLTVADPVGGRAFDADAVAVLHTFAALIADRVTPDAPIPGAVRAREEERRRIARELHDEAGHVLTATVWELERGLFQLPAGAGAAREVLERAHRALLDCVEALHDVVWDLPPRLLDELGLPGALAALAARLRQAGVADVALSLPARSPAIAPATALAAYRVAQEGLTNVRKHAQAGRVWLRLEARPGALVLVVEDDGVGCAGAAGGEGRVRLGVAGMRERVGALGGSLTIGPRPGGGTRLAAHLPHRP